MEGRANGKAFKKYVKDTYEFTSGYTLNARIK